MIFVSVKCPLEVRRFMFKENLTLIDSPPALDGLATTIMRDGMAVLATEAPRRWPSIVFISPAGKYTNALANETTLLIIYSALWEKLTPDEFYIT